MQDPNEAGAAGVALPDDHTVNALETGSGIGGAVNEEIESKLAADQAEREAFPDQVVTVRARDGAQKLGLVVQRQGGGFECEELIPRHARDITLRAGDHLVVIPLSGRDAEEFLRLTKSEPAGPAA